MAMKELITKLIGLIPLLINTEFVSSSEGSTNSGTHESAVAKFFHNNGFPNLDKTVSVKKGRAKKETEEYVMNRNTHAPNDYNINNPDGFYTILQPYSKTGRGAMNPAPDLYLVSIVEYRIVAWIGIECKSSKDSLCPMWNEHLPRPFIKGNILYFFSGYNKETKEKKNTLFTSEIFFQGQDGTVIEDIFWKEVRKDMIAKWDKEYASRFPMVLCKLRQFCGQNPFTQEQMTSMVSSTIEFLIKQK
jgi:hypothetical protein